MAESVVAPTNKLVAFRGRAQKEATVPLKKGKGEAVISENISELHSGATHARTARKFGKKRADKQSVAIALSEARKSGKTKIPRYLQGRGLISAKAEKAFGKKAGHNPPKPTFAQPLPDSSKYGRLKREEEQSEIRQNLPVLPPAERGVKPRSASDI